MYVYLHTLENFNALCTWYHTYIYFYYFLFKKSILAQVNITPLFFKLLHSVSWYVHNLCSHLLLVGIHISVCCCWLTKLQWMPLYTLPFACGCYCVSLGQILRRGITRLKGIPGGGDDVCVCLLFWTLLIFLIYFCLL